MPPNIEDAHNNAENPLRTAAIHFGAYLQQNGLLRGTGESYGKIEKSLLVEQFSNHYQPCFKSCLVLPDLVATLRKYGVVAKHNRRCNNSLEVRVAKHPDPTQVPAPDVVSRPCLYVDQTRIMRDRLVRSDVLNESQCRLCNETFLTERDKFDHVDSDLHKFRLQYRDNRRSFVSQVSGRASVTVEGAASGGEDIQTELVLRIGQQRTVTIRVLSEQRYEETKVFKLIEIEGVQVDSTMFTHNERIEVNVTATFPDTGAYVYPLVFKIICEDSSRICVMKELIFRVGSELMDQLAPVSVYNHQKNISIKEMEGSIVPGERLPKPDCKLIRRVPLTEHKIPAIYTKLLLHKLDNFKTMTSNQENGLKKVLKLLCGTISYKDALHQVSQVNAPYTSPLCKANHKERFQLLIDFEEMQAQRQMKNYDRTDETLQKCSSTFLLEVPDLSEGRPSIQKGDSVHIRLRQGDNTDIIFEGIIHEMRGNGILLGLNIKFTDEYNKLKGKGINPTVDVRFKLNRFPILNMHRALTLLDKHKGHSIVFPERQGSYLPPTTTPTLRPWVNPLIRNNPEQQLAVKNIISKSSDNAPYLIYGPPGTGKTVTLVEAVVQVWYANQTNGTKQVVCAPSNEACNNVARKLIAMLPRTAKILRLYGMSTEVINVPEILLPHSNYDKKSKRIFLPSLKEIADNHIIVATIVSTGRLVTGGAAGMFNYVYVDEAGQATEPETLIAVGGLLTSPQCSCNGQLVLVGDPQQLGPILTSQLAKDFGLGVSMLERLMKDNALYKKKGDGTGYDPKYITKLVQNFRSHETILRIPNSLFYENELDPKADSKIVNKALGWQMLPNKKIPIIFHGVQGLDERESNSPSYFNRQEIDIVISYIEKLLTTGLPNNCKVRPQDIGIISPYRKQVRKFLKAFDILRWEGISVGSVEQFQGSEKLIIFITTVRSNTALVEEDYRFKLGFLKNPKRFNVSVTRAQALLVVVGNPNILRHDKQWYQLIKFCKDNNAYRGFSVPLKEPPSYQEEHVAS